MNRYTVLTLGLALALPCWGAWAYEAGDTGAAGDQGTQLQAPAPQDRNQATPNTAPANPNPAQPNTTPPDQNQAPANAAPPDQAQPDATPPNQAEPNNAPADQNPVAPNNAAPDNTAPNNAAPDNAQPTNPPADQNQPQPNNAAPDNAQPNNPAPDNTQPNGTPPNAAPSDQRQPNPPQDQTQPSPAPGAAATNSGASGSPLRDFVSAQVNEVGELSDQIDQFRAAKRPEAVMALYHMIRDHTLVADAARNVLARRGENSEPTIVVAPATANTPDDMIKHDIEMHQQALSEVQQLLANASTPEEKSIYQRAVNAVNKHLGWLNAMNQGQPVQIGFFGPTTPLNRIAGYREERTTSRVAGYQQSQSSGMSRAHRRIHHRRHGRYSRVRYYR